MNSVSMIGNLTRDPDLRQTGSGKSVVSFTIAVNRNYGDGTDFIPCVAWGATAENIKKYLLKGSKVAVVGSLQSRSYEVDGQKRTAYEVNCSNVDFISRAKEEKVEDLPTEEEPFGTLMDDGDSLPF